MVAFWLPWLVPSTPPLTSPSFQSPFFSIFKKLFLALGCSWLMSLLPRWVKSEASTSRAVHPWTQRCQNTELESIVSHQTSTSFLKQGSGILGDSLHLQPQQDRNLSAAGDQCKHARKQDQEQLDHSHSDCSSLPMLHACFPCNFYLGSMTSLKRK